MNKNPNMEQLASAQKANAEVMMALVRTGFDGIERLTALNIAASRELLNHVLANTKEMMGAKDTEELKKINEAMTKPGMERWMNYSRSLYQISSDMQKEISTVMETQYEGFNEKASKAIDKTVASTPVGGDVFAAAMKSMLDASNKAYDNISSMAKQLSDIAESNLQAAQATASKATASKAPTSKATSAAAKKGK